MIRTVVGVSLQAAGLAFYLVGSGVGAALVALGTRIMGDRA